MSTILDKIVASTKERVARDKAAMPQHALRPQKMAQPHAFYDALLQKPGMAFICEVKKASPSKGLIAPDFPYLQIAKEYEAAGAAAISVLTEPEFFLGSNAYLAEVAEAVKIPVLRKDFTIDEYQVLQARALGASAVLLICSILTDAELLRFRLVAEEWGMDALVESHDEAEVQRAVQSGARIIGVNNRDLKTFEVDTGNSLRLYRKAPVGVTFVSESGISSAEDIATLEGAGIAAVLVGETLMRSGDKKAALDALRGEMAKDRPFASQNQRWISAEGYAKPRLPSPDWHSPTGTRVKVCGLRTAQDVEYANAFLPDFVGLVFAPGKRQVSAQQARALKKALSRSIKTVGVFVNHGIDEIADLVCTGIIDLVQLHGDENAAYMAELRLRVKKRLALHGVEESAKLPPIWCPTIIKAVPVGDTLPPVPKGADYLLFDTQSAVRGGSGKAFDWKLLKGYEGPPFFLAGGLDAGNVDKAVRTAVPYCVDVSSGVETDGYKDPDKLYELIKRVREMKP